MNEKDLQKIKKITTRQAEEAVELLIKYLGEDPNREGLKDTPRRVVAALKEMTSGYAMENDSAAMEKLARSFTKEKYDEIVMLKDISFVSICEHHLMPFWGKIDIGYLPRNKVIGASKMVRIVQMYARRLQIQERLTTQIAYCLHNMIKPLGVGVIARAYHSCISGRGVRQSQSILTTSCMLGVFRTKTKARAEFMELTKRGA